MEPTWTNLASTWSVLGPLFRKLEQTWSQLELTWGRLEHGNLEKSMISIGFLTITPAVADKSEGVLKPLFYFIFGHLDRKKNERVDDLEPNALIGIEFCEFRQKLKNYEFR